jgi:hypothetical protein
MNDALFKSLLDECERRDSLGLVIRTHIVIEQYLNSLIDRLVDNPEYISKMDLDYSSTVKLAMALGLSPRFEKSLNCLGTIRTSYAHNLRGSLSKGDVNNLYKCLSQEDKKIVNDSVKSVTKEVSGQSKPQREMPIEQQFINIVVVLASALHTACNQAKPNKGSHAD